MTSLRAALGIPVIATDTAERLGQTAGVAVDPEGGRITAVHLGGTKGSARFVPWDRITAFGADAVMVDGQGAAREATGAAEERVANGHGDILDKRTLTEIGDDVGTVDDIEFDPDDGRVEDLKVGELVVPGERLLGIGSYAVVVRADDGEA
jgi:sporulation protein YlmC with PRC-barrel domain